MGGAEPWTRESGAEPGLAEHFEHRFRPISASVAVPVFAFFSAGVALGGLGGLAGALADPVALGVMAGLVAGKRSASSPRHGWWPATPAPPWTRG